MWSIIWYSCVLAVSGTLMLRFSGRKSISQMTIPQFAILLSIGAILGSEVGGKGLLNSIAATGTFIGSLVAMEWITMKWDRAETLLKGKSMIVILNGSLIIENLRLLRMSVDDLEKRLRMIGISSIKDIQTGTIEANGEFGYELMPHARPVTMGDLEIILKRNFPHISIPDKQEQEHNLFEEMQNGSQNHNLNHLH